MKSKKVDRNGEVVPKNGEAPSLGAPGSSGLHSLGFRVFRFGNPGAGD